MYYDSLKRRAQRIARTRRDDSAGAKLTDCIPTVYIPLHEDIQRGAHQFYHLPGGRGSCKSSFVSLEIMDGLRRDKTANAVVFRRVGETMRDSVYTQIQWAIDSLGLSSQWRGSVVPLQYVNTSTGQQILFRGLDKPEKIKSIKSRKGAFKYVWFEELSELPGANTVRNVLQSVVRGGEDFKIFTSFNPPLSVNNWANKYVLLPDERATVFRTTYKDVPPEWLGEAFIAEAERLQAVNEAAYRHEYLGEATGTGGEVFPNIKAETLTDDFINELQYTYCGVDFGFSTDPAAVERIAYDAKKQTVYFLNEIYRRRCSNAELAEAIKQGGFDASTTPAYRPLYIAENPIESKLTLICDAAEPKSINDLRGAGIDCIACKKYPGSVLYGIKWLQSKTLVFDPCRTPHAYREFSEYEYLTTKDGEFLADVPDKDNHTIDATRYALDRLINNKKYSA